MGSKKDLIALEKAVIVRKQAEEMKYNDIARNINHNRHIVKKFVENSGKKNNEIRKRFWKKISMRNDEN